LPWPLVFGGSTSAAVGIPSFRDCCRQGTILRGPGGGGTGGRCDGRWRMAHGGLATTSQPQAGPPGPVLSGLGSLRRATLELCNEKRRAGGGAGTGRGKETRTQWPLSAASSSSPDLCSCRTPRWAPLRQRPPPPPPWPSPSSLSLLAARHPVVRGRCPTQNTGGFVFESDIRGTALQRRIIMNIVS